MTTYSFLRTLPQKLTTFGSAREGAVAIWFALVSLPVAVMVGAAVDYSHANAVRTAMQAALDSTALMLSKEAASLTSSQLQTKATAYFNALYSRPDVTNVVVTPNYSTSNGSQVTLTGSGNVKPQFMGVLGFASMTIHGSSTIAWGQ